MPLAPEAPGILTRATPDGSATPFLVPQGVINATVDFRGVMTQRPRGLKCGMWVKYLRADDDCADGLAQHHASRDFPNNSKELARSPQHALVRFPPATSFGLPKCIPPPGQVSRDRGRLQSPSEMRCPETAGSGLRRHLWLASSKDCASP